MSTRLLVAALAILLTSTAGGTASARQVSSPPARPTCIVRLLVPSFPYIAKTSNSSAALQATVNLEADGTVRSVQSDVVSGSKVPSVANVFKAAVETAVKASTFDKACAGEMVRLTFRFKMGSADAVWFEYPDVYEIMALPLPLNRSVR